MSFFRTFFPVYYKGYFVPDTSAADCPTTTKAAPTATTPKSVAAQSWDAPARIQSTDNNAASPVTAIVKPQRNTNDVEVFGSTLKPTKAPQSSVEDLGEKQPPNINIEIHNIFSFGAENANNLSKNGTREV